MNFSGDKLQQDIGPSSSPTSHRSPSPVVGLCNEEDNAIAFGNSQRTATSIIDLCNEDDNASCSSGRTTASVIDLCDEPDMDCDRFMPRRRTTVTDLIDLFDEESVAGDVGVSQRISKAVDGGPRIPCEVCGVLLPCSAYVAHVASHAVASSLKASRRRRAEEEPPVSTPQRGLASANHSIARSSSSISGDGSSSNGSSCRSSAHQVPHQTCTVCMCDLDGELILTGELLDDVTVSPVMSTDDDEFPFAVACPSGHPMHLACLQHARRSTAANGKGAVACTGPPSGEGCGLALGPAVQRLGATADEQRRLADNALQATLSEGAIACPWPACGNYIFKEDIPPAPPARDTAKASSEPEWPENWPRKQRRTGPA